MIDICKIDCEGCEFEALTPILESGVNLNVRQILIEVHSMNVETEVISRFFEAATKRGYAIFHKEANLFCKMDFPCFEFGLLKLNKTFFEPSR